MTENHLFDPRSVLRKVNGNEYLEVKWRLVWLRNQHPDAEIVTELISHEGDAAVFRACVRLPEGGSATGWGSESASDFRDYLEKAETKALGRALAALGYGTQFCPDFDFGSVEGKVVDAPVSLPRGRITPPGDQHSSADLLATEKQLGMIRSLSRALAPEQVTVEISTRFGVSSLEALKRSDASALIDWLQAGTSRTSLAS